FLAAGLLDHAALGLVQAVIAGLGQAVHIQAGGLALGQALLALGLAAVALGAAHVPVGRQRLPLALGAAGGDVFGPPLELAVFGDAGVVVGAQLRRQRRQVAQARVVGAGNAGRRQGIVVGALAELAGTQG